MAAIRIEPWVIAALHREAASAAPRECCGLLLARGGAIDAIRPAANVHPTPHTRFEIDPQVLVDAHRAARGGGPAVAGYYHSHPRGPATPSATDRALAHGDGMVWAIIGRDTVTFWRDEPHGFAALAHA